ncbi:hypothetical protein scyTo_0025929, partial [Scyliorhinus torazame]|nr:hypothetical protein [Scyliorhinus torazame]
QLRSVQEEIDSLEEEKESELMEAHEELHCAQEEIVNLRQAAEEAAGERENEIATLQEELCRIRAELEHLQQTTLEYELEITTLRAEIQMKSESQQRKNSEEVTQLQGTKQVKDGGIPRRGAVQWGRSGLVGSAWWLDLFMGSWFRWGRVVGFMWE